MSFATIAWQIGSRLPSRSVDPLSTAVGALASVRTLPAVEQWAQSVEQATGHRPTPKQRRQLVTHWVRNLLWSMNLAGWDRAEIMRRVCVSQTDTQKLKQSLAGPGLVVALAHMGSWDFAGAWSAQEGIKVVSVAERLPHGMFERFRDARQALGMTIYPLDEEQLLAKLSTDVRQKKMVALLCDRDFSSKGIPVTWPGNGAVIKVPVGPALLARRTGADLRVVTTRFIAGQLEIKVSDRLTGNNPAELMSAVVGEFAEAVRRDPTSWLMLRRAFL